jgi:N-acetylmuramoyl-L-alanine amidase
MKKRSFSLIATLIIVSITLLSFNGGKKAAPVTGVTKIKTIVIDAGHGFKGSLTSRDGTIGTEITEDEVSYEVAKKLVAEIKKQMPDVKVVETRPTPYFVGLKERAEFANANKGDLFVSLHCNSAPRLREVRREGTRTESYTITVGKGKKKKKVKKTREVPIYKTYYHPSPANGTETYVFAANKTEDKEEILMENGDIFQNEKDDSTLNINYNDPVVKQQAALWTKQFFANSIKLASVVEEEFVGIGRFSRGVKQRKVGIWVLQATAMPSILIELGFLTHRPEEEFLMSETGQQTMAESIGRSIKRYKDTVEKGGAVQTNNSGKRK